MSTKKIKETVFQRQIIDACIEVGGYGDKIQDKYVKGKCDIWLSLPSGTIVFVEVKLNQNVNNVISPEFSISQLEYMSQLHHHNVPVLGLCFATRPVNEEIAWYYKICNFPLLKKKWEENNVISFNITDYSYYSKLTTVIAALNSDRETR